jgi:hypothetical protein
MTAEFRLSVRQLDKGDASAFRALRLKALQQEGEKFGPTYENEVRLTYAAWEERVNPTADTRIFGLFNKESLVGIMRVARWDEDPSGKTALWGQAYVLPEYRGRRDATGEKFSAPLYEARARFTFDEHPRYTSAVTFIRQDNEPSQKPHLKHGAEFLYSRNMDWPGRAPVQWNFYRITAERHRDAQRTLALQHVTARQSDLGQAGEPLQPTNLPGHQPHIQKYG